MSEKTLKIVPGILVALKTEVRGGVSYSRVDLDKALEPDGTERSEWQTKKWVADAAEHESANKLRNKCRGLIAAVCVRTPWGFVCPEPAEEELHQKIGEARLLAQEFSAKAKHTEVRLSVFLGRVAKDDLEALRAIRQEMSSLMTELEVATKSGSVQAIRDICGRAKQMSRLLDSSTEPSDQLQAAIKYGRSVARKLVRVAEERAEGVQDFLNTLNHAPISKARFLFSSFDESEGAPAVAFVGANRFSAMASNAGGEE